LIAQYLKTDIVDLTTADFLLLVLIYIYIDGYLRFHITYIASLLHLMFARSITCQLPNVYVFPVSERDNTHNFTFNDLLIKKLNWKIITSILTYHDKSCTGFQSMNKKVQKFNISNLKHIVIF